MMFKKLSFALVAIALAFPASFGQTRNGGRTAAVPVSTKAAFTVGERLSYDVSWRDFIVAGELTLETKDRRAMEGVDAYHVSATAQSVGIVSAFVFKLNDTYESFINAETLEPFRADKRTRRGKKREQASISIDQKNRTARQSDGKTIEIPAQTYDVVGLLYAIRAMELAPGKSRTFNVIEDGRVYQIKVDVEGREKVTTRAGKFDAVRVSTKTLGERESNIYNLKMFITADARRMPVLITAEPKWGEVRVELTSATGTAQK